MPDNQRLITFAEAINEALAQKMEDDSQVVLIGEGVPDPKGIFGTTLNLQNRFSDRRVLDMPLSENGMTGVCIGAALNGLRPVMVHQRIDFSMLAMDQLVNNASKWHYMFGGQKGVPLVVRLIVGRGWGQGPQHSQSLQAVFAHVPGLKTIMPSNAYDAKGMMIEAIEDNNPVIFIEHRWLHSVQDHVPENLYRVPLNTPRVLREGHDLTITATSYMCLEALLVAEAYEEIGLSIEVIDLRALNEIDMQPLYQSVQKTGRLAILDTGWTSYGVSGEIMSRVCENNWGQLSKPPLRISLPDHASPTSHHMANAFYPEADDIARKLAPLLDVTENQLDKVIGATKPRALKDIPNAEFKGPF